MTLHLQTPTGAKTLFARGIKTPIGVKGIAKITIKTPTGDKIVFDKSEALAGGLTVDADPISVTGAVATKAAYSAVTTSPCTASASGGTAPYTYAWSKVSDDGSGGTWSALSPGSAACSFRASHVLADDSSTATFRCTVTDARGATGTVDVIAMAAVYPT